MNRAFILNERLISVIMHMDELTVLVRVTNCQTLHL